jgi:hypothetical protein
VRHTGIEIGATGEWSSPQGGHGGGSNSRGGSASSDRRMAWTSSVGKWRDSGAQGVKKACDRAKGEEGVARRPLVADGTREKRGNGQGVQSKSAHAEEGGNRGIRARCGTREVRRIQGWLACGLAQGGGAQRQGEKVGGVIAGGPAQRWGPASKEREGEGAAAMRGPWGLN